MAAQDAAPVIGPAEKITLIESLAKEKMETGQTWYLVSMEWWRRWHKACTGKVDKDGGVSEAELGPVDNKPLIDDYGNLKELVEGIHVKYVPAAAWQHLVSWYGPPDMPLPRNTIARGHQKYVGLELYPPRLRVLRMASTNTILVINDAPSHPYVTLSEADTITTLIQRLTKAVAPDPDAALTPPALVWKVDPSGDDFNYPEYPLSEFNVANSKSITPSDATLADEAIESEDAFVVEFQQRTTPVFSSGGGFFNRMSSSSSNVVTTRTSSVDTYTGSSLFKSPIKAKAIEPGTLGLGNMGNTCFMNSALQCLAHTKELVEYFTTGLFKDELNPDNPLGMQGAIAESFGALMERIWDANSSSTSYSPREFKSQLQRFAPQFSGYQQHDSQELVAFLLDGLHEDLNRVLKKPYVEKPDWEGGGDLELATLAQTSWDGYMKRNDSVIVDLFQGQYQSTLVCPECDKVSITFDPFMYLTLPLPIKKLWRHDIFWVPWDCEKLPMKIPVEIPADSSFKDLRALLGRWMSVTPENLLTLEIWSGKFYKVLGDHLTVGEAADGDIIVCYELPCHSRQSRSYKPDPDEPFIVPVFLSDAIPASSYKSLYGRNNQFWGHPTIVVIDRETAKSTEAMYDAVIDRLRPWVSNVRDLYTWEGERPIQLGRSRRVSDPVTEDGDGEEGEVEEGDIVDQKIAILTEEDELMDEAKAEVEQDLRKVGTKNGVFALKLAPNYQDYGCSGPFAYNARSNPLDTWDKRRDDEDNPVLLREHDAFILEFEDHLKQYFFGDSPKYENAQWNHWKLYVHPEYKASQEAAKGTVTKGISLQDCLDEFTKKEQLGEDDLWYCPQCKKHQQATKKFDLWKVPDVLVVHLKRFSNSRTLRDKIDVLVDFPIDSLDLTNRVGERAVTERLIKAGVAIDDLDLGDVNGSLVYDLFGVDEHIGGLGGGHYRAYAHNHNNDKWYHFDDSYVSTASPSDAVNPNAYLLFYRRRSSTPLGGKTYTKVQEARTKPKTLVKEPFVTQLPTPPNEPLPFSAYNRIGSSSSQSWPSPRNIAPASPLADDLPALTDDADSDMPYVPDPSSSASPTSSNEAEIDTDSSAEYDEHNSYGGTSYSASPYAELDVPIGNPRSSSPTGSSIETRSTAGYPSPAASSSWSDPFSDANAQKRDDGHDP
ncbi:hypothetical protein CPB85DRAFT_1374694 [Mucidula mucida]|nr:hypothetical protein CPB85DRAFT_1374694 [Mucidula mucida]